jgi:hypothetical protein
VTNHCILAIEAALIVPMRSKICSWIEVVVGTLQVAENAEIMEIEELGYVICSNQERSKRSLIT